MRASGRGFVHGRAADKNGPRALPLRSFWQRLPRPLRAFTIKVVRDLSRPCVARRRIVVFLLAYAAVWSTSATVWNLGRPIHFDMAEAWGGGGGAGPGGFKFFERV